MKVINRERHEQARAVGEGYVWLSSMGLALGLVMIVFLLGLVVVRGLSSFWIRPVAEIHLEVAGAAGEAGSIEVVAGQIVRRQVKMGGRMQEDSADQAVEEWQLFVANRDVFGFSFRFIEAEAVRELSFPRGLMLADRLSSGSVICWPIRLELADGEILEAEDPEFDTVFRERLQLTKNRRSEIRQIERREIGRINRRLERLRLKERRLIESHASFARDSAGIESDRATLQVEYEVLAARARALRDLQEKDRFVYRLASGVEREMGVGQFITFTYPNRLGFLGRLQQFFVQGWDFLTENPRAANTEGGVFPAIFGTFALTLIMSAVVMPCGVVAAIYLREYASQGLLVRMVRVSVNNLAGVPSIVFGVFGLGFFVYFLGGSIDSLFFSEKQPTPTFGTGGILWASLTLALLTLPVVIVASDEALAAVSRGTREASLACGASKWQTIQRVVLPAAAPGVLTGLILAMARGAGEVAPLMLVGVVKLAATLPVDSGPPFLHLDRKFMHLGFHIFDLGFQSPDAEAAKPMVFATTLLLILIVVVLNLGAILMRNHLRRKYAVGTF